jgi:hypothetical protein
MLPNDPLIAFSQAKSTMAERHADAARRRMANDARSTRSGHSVGQASRSMADRYVSALDRLHHRLAARIRAHRPAVGKEPRTVAGS